MKRRFANAVEGDYSQIRIETNLFSGYICNIKIKNIKTPLVVFNGIENVCIKDNGYEWFEIYPDKANYAITIMYDEKENLIEWYFDIAKQIGIQNGIPFEDDLYLDVVVLPSGEKVILDQEELKSALENGEISQADVDLAYSTLQELNEKYVNNFENLKEFTNMVLSYFKC